MKTSKNMTDPVNLFRDDSQAFYRWVRDWSDTLLRLEDARENTSLTNFHKLKLGPQDYCWTGEFRHWVWERDGYRLYVSKRGVSFEVSPDTDIFEALEDYHEKMGVYTTPIPRSERLKFEGLGQKAAQGKELQPGRLAKEDLKKFVLSWCDGQVFTDRHARPSDISMIFLPLALGGAFPQGPREATESVPAFEGDPAWHALQQFSIGDKPVVEGKPTHPGFPNAPIKPEMAPLVKPDPSRIKDIKFNIRWGNVPETALQEYLGDIEENNVRIQDANNALLEQWDQEKTDYVLVCRRIDKQHEKDLAQWERDKASLRGRLAEWVRENARSEAAQDAFMLHWAKNIGIFWEWLSEAMKSRCVNGYPIFFSMKIMHKKDWEIARKAITREMKRRKAFELEEYDSESTT